MHKNTSRKRNTPLQILIHLTMAPRSGGSFSWQLQPEQVNRLADDLRWIVLRRIFPELGGRSPYRAKLQKHAIRVESLDREFFREVLEVVADRHAKSFSLHMARELDDLGCLEEYFLPVILEWACCERSTSVSRERTPSIEDLITHEDSSGNIYQRFPDEFSWIIRRDRPDVEPEAPRELPEEIVDYLHRVARELTGALRRVLESGKLEKYLLLMARLEDNVCTWEMTFDYLSTIGHSGYSSWKSLSVVSNRALKEYVAGLPRDIRKALHQDDNELSKEEKHAILREAVNAALEIDPLPTPQEVLARSA
jgi:hypothetical protein